MKILLAVDDSPSSRVAVEEVARRTWPARSQIKIISAIWLHLGPLAEPWLLPRHPDEIMRAERKQARAVIEKATTKLKSAKKGGLRITAEVLKGTPEEAILDEAKKWGADLIVIGSHGFKGLKRFLLGSVSHAVALHAPCSVEIVRPKQKKRKKRSRLSGDGR